MDTANAPGGEMHYLNNMLDAIGSTPLIRLHKIASEVQPVMLVKM